MIGTYDPVVVALSVLIAVVAAYTALDMATRVLAERGRRRLAWLLGGSIVMGTGIWSMHFVGMLAFQLPVPEAYQAPLTALSAVIAILASGLALTVVSRERRAWTIIVGGILFGLAISGMHYTGMAAMRVPATLTYDPLLVALSIGISIGAACGALWIMFRLGAGGGRGVEPLKMAGGVVLGFAIVGMHYTAMAAAEFTPIAAPMPPLPTDAVISTNELTALVVISTLAILGLALITAAADRKRRLLVAEQARREAAESARERLQNILESITDHFMALDREWRLTYMNTGAAKFFGRSREELLGERLWDLAPDAEGGRFHQQYQRALEQNVPVSFEEESAVAPGRWVEVHAYPSDDGLSVYFRDITERRQAERALKASEERYRQLFERSPIGVYRSTPAGELLAANPAMVRMLGYASFDELASYNITEIAYASPEDRQRFRDLVEREGEVQGLEAVWLRRDGTELYVRENARPVRAEDGTILYFEGTVEDVTDQRELEEKLLQSRKMDAVGQLAGGIAHDFNNLLTSIQGHSRLLLEELGENDPIREDAREIANAAERASGLTRQLLTFSRREIVQPRRLDLNAVVLEMEDMLRRLIRGDIDLAVDLMEGDACVTADLSQIQQVVLNLALNAKDAMPDGGALRIATRRVDIEDGQGVSGEGRAAVDGSIDLPPDSYTTLRVEDTGHGIDPETLMHVFEPFFTTKEQGAGTGLGLSTVHGIVEQSGGAIQVESEPGVGTTFTVYLPCAEDIDEQDRAGGDGAHVPVRSGEAPTATVLVVEDEPAVRSLARKVLARHGYRVLEAEGGRSALRIAEEHEGALDLVLTDIVMPEMDGRELGDRLRESRPETPVVYMSGYTRDEALRRGIFRSEFPFLEKPFSPTELLSMVQDCLGRGGR